MVIMSDQFREWLTAEMTARRLSQRALAREMGISQPFVSRVISGENQPSVDFCVKVAEVLSHPPDYVFRLAGLLPPIEDESSIDETVQEMIELIRNLPTDQRQNLLAYIRFLYQQNRPPD